MDTARPDEDPDFQAGVAAAAAYYKSLPAAGNLTDAQVRAQLDAAANAPAKPDVPHPVATEKLSPVQVAQMPPPPRQANPTFLDSLVSHVDNLATVYSQMNPLSMENETRGVQNAGAGLIKGIVNAADSTKSFMEQSGKGLAMAEDPAHAEDAAAGADPLTPIYNDARQAVMNFRDAIAVKDPSFADNLQEGAWQLVPSFLMFSRLTGAIGGLAELGKGGTFLERAGGNLARFVAADTPNSAVMVGPHDPRLADMFSLLRTSEGKLGDIFRTMDNGTGHLLSHYIDYVSNHKDESEAEGRWKNVLDSYGGAAALTGLIHISSSVFKQGWNAMHFMARGGMEKLSDIPVRPPLRQGDADPLEAEAERQAKIDADAAEKNPNGKRPPLVQGGADPMEALAQQQAREDADRATLGAALPEEGAAVKGRVNPPGSMEADATLSDIRGTMQLHAQAGLDVPANTAMQLLATHLDGTSPQGAFYKELFTKLSGKKLEGSIVPPGVGRQPAEEAGNRGYYSSGDNTIAIHSAGYRNNATFAHTLGHEAVHMATFNAIKSDFGVREALMNVLDEARAALSEGSLTKQDTYGLLEGKPTELVAEAESNPRFQQFLKTAKGQDGRPLWDHYKEAIGGIFGLSAAAIASPMFDKVLTREKDGA